MIIKNKNNKNNLPHFSKANRKRQGASGSHLSHIYQNYHICVNENGMKKKHHGEHFYNSSGFSLFTPLDSGKNVKQQREFFNATIEIWIFAAVYTKVEQLKKVIHAVAMQRTRAKLVMKLFEASG